MFRIQNIRFFLLVLLLVLTAFTYLPVFSNVVTTGEGSNPLNRYVVLAAILCFLFYFDYRSWMKNRLIVIFIICIFLAGIIGVMLAQMDVTKRYQTAAGELLIAFLGLAIGYSSKLSKKQLITIVIIYSSSVAIVTYQQLMQHAGGFIISDLYFSYGKNTLGVMCAVSCVSLIISSLNVDNKYMKFFMRALYLFILVLCISIRARASFLVIFLLTFFCIYKQMKHRRITMGSVSWVVFGGLFIVGVLLVFPQLFYSISDYIIDSFTRNHEGDITAGRERGWRIGVSVISNNPLFGNMVVKRQYDFLSIHNYFLRILSEFGIVGSLPFMILYLRLVFLTIRKSVKLPINIENVGFFTTIVLLIISLEEPTFPYSPGTGVIMSFILLGNSLRINERCSHVKMYQLQYT